MKQLISLSFVLLACGDNSGIDRNPDAGPPDARPDAPPFVAPTPVAVQISTAGNDQLLAAAAAPSGGFYAVGWRAATHDAAADRELVLVKLNGMGELDTSFGGGDGIATLNVQTGGAGEVYRGLVVQPDGKIVASGTVEDELVSSDRDVVVVRFNTDGTPDTTFDTDGVVRLDLNTALAGTMGVDATWGLATDATGRLYVHAAQRTATLDASNLDTLTDTDYVVVRLAAANGAIDTTFGTNGKFMLDIERSNANVRSIHILPDGSVVASGYSDSASLGQSDVQPVLYKLTPAGQLDTNFATGGVFHQVVLAFFTEVYGLAIQPDNKIVTAGYGRNDMNATNDWVSLRFTAAGALDATWANAGKYLLDPTGMNVADNNRHAIALPGGRTALLGSGGPATTTSDAYIVILDSTGKPDTKFGTGIMKFDMGSNDQFFGAALATNGNRALFVGFKGGGATPSATSNDDAYVVTLSLQ